MMRPSVERRVSARFIAVQVEVRNIGQSTVFIADREFRDVYRRV
jgi:hypothetical protein